MREIQKQTDGFPQASRRRFLAAVGRTASLTVLGGLGAVLVFKRSRLLREGACLDPAGQIECRRCGAYASCGLTRAVSARRSTEKKYGQ